MAEHLKGKGQKLYAVITKDGRRFHVNGDELSYKNEARCAVVMIDGKWGGIYPFENLTGIQEVNEVPESGGQAPAPEASGKPKKSLRGTASEAEDLGAR